jgi:hypothetical protein
MFWDLSLVLKIFYIVSGLYLGLATTAYILSRGIPFYKWFKKFVKKRK